LKVFIAPLNWGLGHATRLMPVIKKFNQLGAEIYIGATARALDFLKKEVPYCHFFDFPGYPIKYPRTRFFVTRFMFIIFPQMLMAMWREKRLLHHLQNKYNFDIILSDNRFSLKIKGPPCYLISHQLRYKLPWPIHRMEWLPEYFNYRHFNKYKRIIVPDYTGNETLTGELSHRMRFLPQEKLFYMGILTDVRQSDKKVHQDIDYFVIVSGPEPQRTKFERMIFKQIKYLRGTVIVALGKPESDYKIRIGSAVVYSFLNRDKMAEYFQRAKFIIGRPGYTSVMEMVELGKKGMFIPTPGQVEQIYLGRHFHEQEWCYSVSQNNLNLTEDLPKALKFKGFPARLAGSKDNVEKLFTNVFLKK
jgi:uncharacterized protein (TIGR00661 family)